MSIPKPEKEEVENYLSEWKQLEKYVAQEESLNYLFNEIFPENDTLSKILVKVASLNTFYSTNIFSPYSMAKHIEGIPKIDLRLKKGDPQLVEEIAKVKIKNKQKYFYSFATKYCSHHNPKDYPIYDRYVGNVLYYFQAKKRSFSRKDLKNYSRYKTEIEEFRKNYDLEKYSFKDIDRYLWQLGKEHFSIKKPKASKKK